MRCESFHAAIFHQPSITFDFPVFALSVQISYQTHFCSFVFGLNWAIAVSVRGAKKMLPPCGLAPKPMPCEDFFPTNFTGNSFPFRGPARNAAAGTENNLKGFNLIYFGVFDFFCEVSEMLEKLFSFIFSDANK